MKFRAKAHSNIALVKYWGKSDEKRNMPAAGSFSVTLKDLYTETYVSVLHELREDAIFFDGKEPSQKDKERITRFLDTIRETSGRREFAKVVTENNFPAGAGLASSASGYAALAAAASRAFGLELRDVELSELARMGSGSAARSVYGGFAEMIIDGDRSYAVQAFPEEYWDIDIIIAVTDKSKKEISSREAMAFSPESTFYKPWIEQTGKDLGDIRESIKNRDIEKTGHIAETNCLRLHALIMSSGPGIIYWNPTTLEVIRYVRELRKNGIPCWFTIDAGPQVKIITLPEFSDRIKKGLQELSGVKEIIITKPGPGVSVREDEA